MGSQVEIEMGRKKQRGAPIKYPMPEPLNVDMDALAEVVLKAAPKETWQFERDYGRSRGKKSH